MNNISSNILLACLAVTDLLVGIVAQPTFTTLEIFVLVGGSSSLAWTLYNWTQLIILVLCILLV